MRRPASAILLSVSRRALGVALAVSLSALALAHEGSVLVCRYSGQIVNPCDCPTAEEDAKVDALDTESCCEIRATHAPSVPGVLTLAPEPPAQTWAPWFPPESSARLDAPPPGPVVVARQQSPPPIPLYLASHQLLI
jgi:hypothetical protein